MKKHSKSKNRSYYYNLATGESRWEKPESFREDEEITEAPHLKRSKQEVPEIRASHLLVKHKDSRNPSSWKETQITRTKEEARKILEGNFPFYIYISLKKLS